MAEERLKLRDIVVLALLKESPRYGYEIKTIIDTIMSHIIDISSGSLYYGLKKLEQDGLVAEATTEKVGRRPERSVYKITELGQQALQRTLPRVIFPEARPVFPINLALYFWDQLPSHELVKRLQQRRAYLDYVDKMLVNFLAVSGKSRSLGQVLIIKHHARYVAMERDFIDELLVELAGSSPGQLDAQDSEEVEEEFLRFLGRLRAEDAAQARGTNVSKQD